MAQLTGGKFYEGAMMGAVSGAVGFAASELVGQYFQKINEQLFRAMGILGPEAYRNLQKQQGSDKLLYFDTSKENYLRLQELYNDENYQFNPDIQFMRRLHLFGSEPTRFSGLDVRFDGKVGVYHFDKYDIVPAPSPHILINTLYQGIRYGCW